MPGTTEDDVRRRLERAGAEFMHVDDDGWRARLGGGVAVYEDGGVSLIGNTDRLASILTDGGGRVTVEFDGASRGNPGRSAVGYVIRDEDGVVKQEGEVIGEATNNEAEYVALLRGLVEARELGYGVVEAVGDSELVVKQVGGDWRCRADNLKPLCDEVLEVAGAFDEFGIRHVPRGTNEEADEMANRALDEA
ncbi:MAG: ribonuclease HI family protein [Halobacteria archaeon]